MKNLNTLQHGKVYYSKCPDNPEYFRSIRLSFNPYTQGYTPQISNPVCGVPPEGLEEISPVLLQRLMKVPQNTPPFWTMTYQNPLEEILYGTTYGKRTFTQFRDQIRESEEKNGSLEEDRTRGSKKRTDTVGRMEKSYQRRQREKKIEKLSNDSGHWKGLE